MEQSRVRSYLGFCKRAGKLTLGTNAARCVRGRVYLLVADRSASANCQKEIAGLARRFSCPVVWTDGLGEMVGKEMCKVAAVREEHLAAALGQELKE